MAGRPYTRDHRQVAHEFVEKYYHLLQKTPDQLYKFYKKQSVFVFSRDSDGAQAASTGQDQIRTGIMIALQPFGGPIHMVSKCQVDSQASREGGLLVTVTGQLFGYDGYCQHFTQSFLLDEQELPTPGYFVLMDFLRYVETSPSVGSCQPSGGVPVMSNEAMMCQDQCMAPQLGGMPMISPHDVGQQQAWMQPGMHPSMMQEMNCPVPSPQRPMAMQNLPHDAAATGFPPASQLHHPAAQASMVDPNIHQEEPPTRLSDAALAEQIAKPCQISSAAVARGESCEAGDYSAARNDYEIEDGRYDMGGCHQESEANGCYSAYDGDMQDDGYTYDGSNEPRSWASMAGKLNEGSGRLAQGKVSGFGSPVAILGNGKSGTSSSSAARPDQAVDTRDSYEYREAWLWVSRIPLDPHIEDQEVLDFITSHLCDHGARALEIERKEHSQDWASISVSSQEAADAIVHLSRERRLLLRGRSIKADLHNVGRGAGRRGRAGRSGEGGFKGFGRGRGYADVADDDRYGDGRGGRRGRRQGKGDGKYGGYGDGFSRW